MDPIVADTSILINGELVRLVHNGLLDGHTIIIPTAVLDELQSQASQKKEQGYVGLQEIKQLRQLSTGANITLTFTGDHPSTDDVMLAESGRIDAIIKDVARDNAATLFTSDRAQSLVAEAEGVRVQYHSPRSNTENLEFLKFFDENTMSVHLKEDLPPMAKRGLPGQFELVQVGDELLTRDYLQEITAQIVESARSVDSGNTEISLPGAMVVQHDDYRIAITKPPFSESFEITIVHPTVKMSLEDYSVSEKLMDRFAKHAEGVIISGAPGSGKSTLASGLANFYHKQGKIVKTFESPRDLQVDQGITQYTKLDGSFENSADILLLVRPDYTVFDEVRRREDFEVYSDLRLTGVGMVGVVHANSPIDSIQRFVGKIELGMIPSVLDTVVFIDGGKISKVYQLELKVKVPSGMTEQDLARPLIEITNFEDGKPEYEIYTFGEENVIIPVTEATGDDGKKKASGIEKLAADKIRDVVSRYDPGAHIEVLSGSKVRIKVAQRAIPSIIGRGGSNINDLQDRLGLHIDVTARDDSDSEVTLGGNDGYGRGRRDRGRRDRGRRDGDGRGYDDDGAGDGGGGGSGAGPEIRFDYSESKPFLIFEVDSKHAGQMAEIHLDGQNTTTWRIDRKGQIRIPRRSRGGRDILESSVSPNNIRILLTGS